MARPVDPNAKVELLRAAEAVFVERGLEKARVEEITARAGRSKGSFYLHFESKEEAFRQIVEAMVARLASFLDCMELDAPRDLPIDEILHHLREREADLFEFLWANRGLMRMLLQGGGGAQFAHLIDAFAERARERTKDALRLGIEAGHYREDLDVEIASLAISGAYDRLARELVRLDKKPDFRTWILAIQRFFLAGMATDEVRSVADRLVSGNFEPPPVSAASPTARGSRRLPKRPRLEPADDEAPEPAPLSSRRSTA